MKVEYGRAECPRCVRSVATLVPQGGDGSVEVFRLHRTTLGGICSGSRLDVHAFGAGISEGSTMSALSDEEFNFRNGYEAGKSVMAKVVTETLEALDDKYPAAYEAYEDFAREWQIRAADGASFEKDRAEAIAAENRELRAALTDILITAEQEDRGARTQLGEVIARARAVLGLPHPNAAAASHQETTP